MPLIHFETLADSIGMITLSDPDRLNAMSEEMAGEFSLLVEKLRKDSSSVCRVIILTGAGRAFSAGGDLDMLQAKAEKPPEQNEQEMLTYYRSFLSIRDLQVPIIAAINGHAVGAGLCLACACDLRVVSKEAKLGFTFTRIGLFPGMGATYFIPRLLGAQRAMELMITGKLIEGQDIVRYGFTPHLVKPTEVETEAISIAEEIVRCAPVATGQLLKHMRGEEKDLQAALENEALQQANSYATSQFREGINALKEKRAPNWGED